MKDAPAVLELRDVCADGADETVRGVSAVFEPGRLHVLRGAAESGRGLLLRLLGLWQPPASGEVFVQGRPTTALGDAGRAELRTRRFGFVFATPFLLSSFTVIENVAMPLFKVSQVGPAKARQRTEAVLDFVGLTAVMEETVGELPPCAQYQCALARGLINDPSFLLVENVDALLASEELLAFAELLRRAGEDFGVTVIASATHALPFSGPQRVLDLAAGAIVGDAELLPERRG